MKNVSLEVTMMKRIGELKAEVTNLKSVADQSKAENARLKAEVERLSKPAIIGGYNLSQYIRMANSETLEFDNGDIFSEMTLPERIKYIVESHARLKAEVERLTSDLQMEKENEDRLVREWQKANNEVYGLQTQVAALIDDQTSLKAEVERLKQQVDYWRIESDCNHGRWLRCLEDLEHLRASSFVTAVPSEQYERVIKAGDKMANICILLGFPSDTDEWNTAKNGGQP